MRAAVPGRLPDGDVVQPLYGDRYEVGAIVEAGDGVMWEYAPRYPDDPKPWRAEAF